MNFYMNFLIQYLIYFLIFARLELMKLKRRRIMLLNWYFEAYNDMCFFSFVWIDKKLWFEIGRNQDYQASKMIFPLSLEGWVIQMKCHLIDGPNTSRASRNMNWERTEKRTFPSEDDSREQLFKNYSSFSLRSLFEREEPRVLSYKWNQMIHYDVEITLVWS